MYRSSSAASLSPYPFSPDIALMLRPAVGSNVPGLEDFPTQATTGRQSVRRDMTAALLQPVEAFGV